MTKFSGDLNRKTLLRATSVEERIKFKVAKNQSLRRTDFIDAACIVRNLNSHKTMAAYAWRQSNATPAD
jgi:hypothetical protein